MKFRKPVLLSILLLGFFTINLSLLSAQKVSTATQTQAGGATLVEVDTGECGCKKYRAAIGKRCRGQYTWQIQRKVGWLVWQNVGPQVLTAGGSSADWEFELCPLTHQNGEYRVKIKCTKGWLFSRKTNKLTFSPSPYNIELETLLNGSANYIQHFCCGEDLTLTTKHQSCVLRWRIYVRKWNNTSNTTYGPLYAGLWQTGQVPSSINMNDFFQGQNLDLVPGNCYKFDVEVQGLVNGTQWPSVGKIFCIKCKCEG